MLLCTLFSQCYTLISFLKSISWTLNIYSCERKRCNNTKKGIKESNEYKKYIIKQTEADFYISEHLRCFSILKCTVNLKKRPRAHTIVEFFFDCRASSSHVYKERELHHTHTFENPGSECTFCLSLSPPQILLWNCVTEKVGNEYLYFYL